MNKLIRIFIFGLIATVFLRLLGGRLHGGDDSFAHIHPAPNFTDTDTDTDNNTDNNETQYQKVRLNWTTPKQRINGEKVSTSDIMGYVIFYFGEQALQNIKQPLWSKLGSLSDFNHSNTELKQLISLDQIGQLATQHPSNSLVINNGSQNSVTLNFLNADTYHFAISSFDASGSFSELSKTTRINIRQ